MNNFLMRIITGFFLLCSFIFLFGALSPIYFSHVLAAILLLMLITEWPYFFSVRTLPFWLVMPLYPIAPFAMMIYLNQSAQYRVLVALLFASVALFDSFSYLSGKMFGRHLIAPTISPRKTWEGACGGYVCTILGMQGVLWMLNGVQPWMRLSAGMLVVCVLGLCGDLFESWLKRRSGIKDSGSILPGHGGFFDRFDGIMFAAPVFFLLRNYLIKCL